MLIMNVKLFFAWGCACAVPHDRMCCAVPHDEIKTSGYLRCRRQCCSEAHCQDGRRAVDRQQRSSSRPTECSQRGEGVCASSSQPGGSRRRRSRGVGRSNRLRRDRRRGRRGRHSDTAAAAGAEKQDQERVAGADAPRAAGQQGHRQQSRVRTVCWPVQWAISCLQDLSNVAVA